jgi:hypothetical protein
MYCGLFDLACSVGRHSDFCRWLLAGVRRHTHVSPLLSNDNRAAVWPGIAVRCDRRRVSVSREEALMTWRKVFILVAITVLLLGVAST